MNPNSLVFGHQREVVRDLIGHFDSIQVITSDPTTGPMLDGVFVSSSAWKPGKKLWSSYRFLLLALPIILRSRKSQKNLVIFSYMTEVQSALIAPISRVLGIRHFLWYAHTSKSLFLRWCHFWVTGILTSTKDSCPYESSKVSVIGQAIDSDRFKYSGRAKYRFYKGIYVGRFDRSKNLESIINFLRETSQIGLASKISLVGEATMGNEQYIKSLIDSNRDLLRAGTLEISARVPNNHLPPLLKQFDFFINSFSGSLDKSLVEATLIGLPVVTVNPPYLREFGSWQGSYTPAHRTTLIDEYLALYNLEPGALEETCKARSQHAVLMHSRKMWLQRLLRILKA